MSVYWNTLTLIWYLWGLSWLINRPELNLENNNLYLRLCSKDFNTTYISVNIDNAWMISGLKLSSTLPKVSNKSWKQRQIKGDRWRPAKNPPMAKLVSLWFWFEGKVNRSSEWITLFVDQCFYNTPTEQSSPFM